MLGYTDVVWLVDQRLKCGRRFVCWMRRSSHSPGFVRSRGAGSSKRWLWRYREHYCEESQYKLEKNIDQLKVDLEGVLSEGCD